MKLPSTLCGLPCIPVYKYKINLFTFYDIWLQLKISFRKSCKVISIYCNIIMQGWNWPESQSKIRKLTHYLQSRPTAEIAILVCRSQGDSEPSWLESMILLKSKSLSWSWTSLYSPQSLFNNIMGTRAAKMQGPNCIGRSTVSCLGPHCWGTPLIQPACRVFSWNLVHSVVQKLLEVPIVRVHIFVV